MASEGVLTEKCLNHNLDINSLLKITILVVDDDSTSLAIVSAMLRGLQYKVTTVRNSHDALTTLRERPGIDLVVTDLHMPDMNGIELQKQINAEFKVPVIIMSSDDKESVILQCLAGGAVFYIVKPVNPEDLKNVWQYAVKAKKGKSLAIKEVGSIQGEPSSATAKITGTEDRNSASSTVSDENQSKRTDAKRKSPSSPSEKGKDDVPDDHLQEHQPAPKKAKVVWTSSLHTRFLQAIGYLGFNKAVPKRILEFMNVPGLTRENVASHLQKYRLFLKRLKERGFPPTKTLTGGAIGSSFAAGHQLFSNTQLAHEWHQQAWGILHPHVGLGSPTLSSLTSTPNFMALTSHNGSALSSNSVPQLGYGQSQFMLNQTNSQSVLSITGASSSVNPLHDRSGFGMRSSFAPNLGSMSSSSLRNSANSMVSSANSLHFYQPQSDLFNVAGSSSAHLRFSASSNNNTNIHGSSSNKVQTAENMDTAISNFYRSPNASRNGNNRSYTGIQISTDGKPISMGQFQSNNTSNVNGGYRLTNGTGNNNDKIHQQNMNLLPGTKNGNATSGYHLSQGGRSSSTFSAGLIKGASATANPVNPASAAASASQRANDLVTLDSIIDSVTNSRGEQGGGIDDILFDPANNDFSLPESVEENDFWSDLEPTLEQLLNFAISDSVSDKGNHSSRSDQALGQLVIQNGQEMMNSRAGSSSTMQDYRPSYGQNPIQEQNGGDFLDPEPLNSIYALDDAEAENQPSSNDSIWSDDFMESLMKSVGQ